MKKIGVLFPAALILLAFAGCKKIEHGVVVDKWHEDSRTYIYYTSHRVGKSWVSVPHTGYDDEDWKIKVSDKEGDRVYEEEDELSQFAWNQVEIGDSFFRDSTGRIFFHHNAHEVMGTGN